MYVKIKRVIDYERYKHDIHRFDSSKKRSRSTFDRISKKTRAAVREEK